MVFCRGQYPAGRVHIFFWNIIIVVSYAICAGGLVAASRGNNEDVLVWVKTPQPTALAKGDDLILACEVRHFDRSDSPFSSSHEPLFYSWTKDDEPIPSKASMYSNHSLFVPRVRKDDFGQYTCTVTVDGWVPLSASANVIQAYLEPFLVQPQSQTITTGQTFVLTCVTGQSAPYLEVYWTKDGERFYDGTQITAAFGDYDEEGLRLQTSLRLDIIASSDSTGTYQCVAWNKLLGSPVLSVPASVATESIPSNLLPVIDWTMPETLVIAEGQNFTLGCRSQVSTEPVEINWFLGRYLVDESKRVYVLPNASLAFLPVSARDRGSYHCRASNSKGTTKSPEVELVIAYILIQFQEEPSDTFALYGQHVVLKCQPPNSLPAASVVWYKDYTIFNTSSRPGAQVVDNDLHLNSVTRSDIGSYYCVAINSMTNPSSRTSRVARLNIEGPPQMTQPPVSTKMIKGSLLHLSCLAESDPKPIVTWTFAGKPLTQDDDVTIMNSGQELWISNAGKAWEGDFICNCSNKYGSISASATVTITVPPVSLHSIGLLKTTSGSTLTISCPVDGSPVPSILWFHNDTNIQDKGRLNWKTDGLDLIISEVTPEYSGTYKCDASNEGGIVTSAGKLVVYVSPYILEAPQNISVVVGKRGSLTCDAGGNYPPSINWVLNDSLPVGGVLSADNKTLTFPSMGWEDVGVYTCVASNGVGLIKRSATVSVQVPPSIVSTNQPNSPIKIKSQFVLSCGTNGLPPPSIKWTHRDIPILPSLNGRVRFPMAGMLVVESAQEEDAGVYKCIAESQAGTDTASFSIRIYGRPHPPTLLAAVPLSSSSVYLLWEWSEVDSSGISQTINSFKIFYRKKSSEDVETYPHVFPSNMTRVEVMDLDPGISYVFYVKAINDAGSSEPSNLLTSVTFNSAPSVPTNLRVLELQPVSAVVTWEPPASPNGEVKMYQLRYKREGVAVAYETINITDPTFPTQEVTLQSLRPAFNYTVQTRAATLHDNKELWGNFSSPFIFQTKMTVPSLPPQFVKVKAIDPHAISVTWEPVPDLGKNGPITGYFVLCLDSNRSLVASHRVEKSFNRRSVFGLSPWRQYWVSVKGENLMGLGPESEPVSVRTLPIAPVTIPEQFAAESHSSSSISLSWKPLPPSSITCEITEYLIRYRRKKKDDVWATVHIMSNFTTHILTSLDPWTAYEFSIAAFTDTVVPGLGPYTEPIVVSTLQGESSPVTALAFTAHSTSISLSWKPPLDIKGNLVGYSIHYQIMFVDSTAKSKNLSVHATSCLLTSLLPNTSYRININPRNEERNGQTRAIIVKTLPLKPSTESAEPPATTDSFTNISSINTVGFMALQEEDQVQNHVKKNLASIVGASIVGSIALIILIIFICTQCKKYRKKQRLSYDVDGENGTIQQHNEQTPTDQQEQQDQQQSTATTASADNCRIDNNSSQPTTQTHQQTQGGEGEESITEKESVNNGHQHQQSYDDSTDSGQKSGNVDGKSEKSKSPGLRRFSKPSIFQGQGYSKLDEEGEGKEEASPDNASNPVSIPNKGMKTVSSAASVDGITSTQSADDTISIMSDTLKRRSRMRSESAAAIAMLRNSQIVDVDDSGGLIDNEIHTEVIFNERTVL